MKSLWQVGDRQELVERLRRVGADHPARWGKMDAPQMVAHCADAVRMALGTLPVPSKRLPTRYPPLKQILVYLLPFPKSVPTAPELIQRRAGDWNTEVADLIRLMEELAARRPNDLAPEHPAFGTMSHNAWGVLGYKHLDHHLRQFGK
ncbi:MAG: DUF1569 domain-containing protein [Gemmatimonadaceae bacterium]